MSDDSPPPDDIAEADTFQHPDGTTEIVFTRAEGRLLTVREYESIEDFESAIRSATYHGTHDGIASLPDPQFFADSSTEDDN